MLNKPRVLIAGGAGFIGRRICDVISERADTVISIDRSPFEGRNTAQVHAITGDVTNLESVKEVIINYEIDTLIHLVGLPLVSDCHTNPALSYLLNVASVQSIIEPARGSKVRKIIFASSAAVYGKVPSNPVDEGRHPVPTSVYGWHKYAAECLIRAYTKDYELECIILRLFNVYGNNPRTGKDVVSNFLRQAISGNPVVVEGGSQFRDFIHVDDVAQAFRQVMIKNVGNETINIGTGIMTTIGEVASLVREAFSVDVEVVPGRNNSEGLCANISKARTLLGYEPKVDGLKEYINSWTSHTK